MNKGNVEIGRRSGGTVEPTGSLWTTLKVIFLIVISLLILELIALIYACVALGGIINGDPYFTYPNDPYPEVTQRFAKIMLGIAIPTVILIFFQCLTGFIGIVKLGVGYLYTFCVLMSISMIISFVNFFGSGVYRLAPLIAAGLQMGIVRLVGKIISMINEVNGV